MAADDHVVRGGHLKPGRGRPDDRAVGGDNNFDFDAAVGGGDGQAVPRPVGRTARVRPWASRWGGIPIVVSVVVSVIVTAGTPRAWDGSADQFVRGQALAGDDVQGKA